MALPRFDEKTKLRMVDISNKRKTMRTAMAEGFIFMSKKTLNKVMGGQLPKGDVISLSITAGILAAKKTPSLIPMCHNIAITHCDIGFEFIENGIRVFSEVKSFDRTGVEMEALTAVSVALLNIFDMVKSIDKSMEITGIKILKKTGGKSGDYFRKG